MPQVGLAAADRAGPLGRAAGRERLHERERLVGVAARAAGAVRLEVVDLPRRDPGALERAPDQPALGQPAGHRVPVREPVVRDGAAADQAPDAVAVAPRVGQALEDHHAAALGAHEAVAVLAEAGAAALRREPAGHRARDALARQQVHVDPAAERQIALAAAQALRREVQREERGRAGGVDGEAGPLEVERVRDAVGDEALVRVGADVGVELG